MPVRLVSGKVEHRAGDHDVKGLVAKTHLFNSVDAKVVRRQMRRELRGQRSNLCDCLRRLIDAARIESAPEKIDEIAAAATAGIKHPHLGRDSTLEELVEQINVDAAELFLEI